jgi:hypothetical protein
MAIVGPLNDFVPMKGAQEESPFDDERGSDLELLRQNGFFNKFHGL